MIEAKIAKNMALIKENIRISAQKVARDPKEIQLLAVSKMASLEEIKIAYNLGQRIFAENKVQEILTKKPLLPADIKWHLIGSLQTNKVKSIIDKVELIHSLDRWSLAEEISKRATELGILVKVLVQVNISGEKTKSGLSSIEIEDFINESRNLSGIKIKGLMTMAPLVSDSEEIRYIFRELVYLSNKIKQNISSEMMEFLSMGMTNDYQVAIEEGANIIRIGRAFFK